jgi:hypothetical protein
MAEYKDREHYIPLRKADLVELLCTDKRLSAADKIAFRQFCTLISAVFHFEYHAKLEELKNDYAPFDPDRVEKPIRPLLPEERQQKLDQLFEQFQWLMERANFKKLDKEQLEQSRHAASEFGLPMKVDYRIFEKLAGYVRGDIIGRRFKRHWLLFWRREEVRVPVYVRLAVIVKLRKSRRLPRDINTDAVFIKIFKDIPKMDLEMLLPSARLRMPGMQRLKLGGSWAGGLGYLLWSLSAEIVNILQHGWWLFWGPLAALGGYGYKQWAGYQSTRTNYSLQLTESLYYQNLDNNAGVLFHLLDEAEEQECREAILAYYFLWRRAPAEGWTSADLDDYVEMELERMAELKVDFEIGDALAKLERHKLVLRSGPRYRVLPIDKALETLDYTWDNYFKYNTR